MEDAQTKARIKETVLKILHESNLEEATISKIRKQASIELDLNLNQPPFKALVKQIIEAFIVEKQQQQLGEEEEKQRQKEGVSGKSDFLVCKLSNKRKVTILDYNRIRYVSIRDFYTKDNKEFPASKGIHLSVEQWEAFKKCVPDIENAINKMESRI